MLNLFNGGNSLYRQTNVMAAAPLPHLQMEELNQLLSDQTNYRIALLVLQGIPSRAIAQILRLPIATVVARIRAMSGTVEDSILAANAWSRLRLGLLKYKEWHDQKRGAGQK